MSNEINFSPVRRDIRITSGDTINFKLSITDAAGDPADLSDLSSVKMQVRTQPAGVILFDATIGDGITVTGSDIFIDKIVEIDAGPHRYDIQLTWTGGKIRTIMNGIFRVTSQITT